MKFAIVKKILISLCVALVAAYLVFAYWEYSGADQNIICTNLEIQLMDQSGTRLISEFEVAKMIDKHELNPVGLKYKNISTERIEEVLLGNDMIRTVECYKNTTGKVVVQIKQRTPKYLIAGNQSYYVDSELQLMPVSLNYAVYVPVVSGRVLRNMATGVIYDFVSYVEKDTFWNAQIEQIYIRDDLKVELIPRVGNATIILGTFDGFEDKLKSLRELYMQAFSVVGWNRYEKIDLQYNGQIVCTRSGTIPDVVVAQKDTVVLNDSIVKKI